MQPGSLDYRGLINPTVSNYSEVFWNPPAGSLFTINLRLGTYWKIRSNGNVTMTFPPIEPGVSKSFVLEVEWGGTHTMTWPATTILRWAAATAPTVTGAVNKSDIFTFVSNGTIWSGFTGGLAYVW